MVDFDFKGDMKEGDLTKSQIKQVHKDLLKRKTLKIDMVNKKVTTLWRFGTDLRKKLGKRRSRNSLY